MKLAISAITEWLASALVVIVVVWFWQSYTSHGRMKEAAGVALSNTHRPYVLNGLQLRLDRHLAPRFVAVSGRSHYLVFVSSDSCLHSQAQAAELADWLKRVRLVPPTLLISFDEGTLLHPPLVSALRARGVPYQVLRVQHPAAFSEDTGLAWTPVILMLDANLRVRMVAEGLSAAVETRMAELLERGGGQGRGE